MSRGRAGARLAAVTGLVLAACGSPAPATAPTARALPDAPPAAADDVVVARVDGHPVWGSCVTAQAARIHGDRAAALRDCVDFEVLAQRAAATGHADDPEVTDAVHTAMVERVIASYEDTSTPAELEPEYGHLARQAIARLRHPEYRGSSFVRVPVAPGASEAEVARARQVAARIAAALGGERGLSDPQLLPLARPIADAAGVTLAHQALPPTLPSALETSYATALFAVAEVGRTTGPIRTSLGWDVILFAEDVPAAAATDDEVRAAVIGDARRAHFVAWTETVERRLGVTVRTEPGYERTLDEAP